MMSRLSRSYTAMDHCYRHREDKPERLSSARGRGSRAGDVDIQPLQNNRYYSNIATQTDVGAGFPIIPLDEKMTRTQGDRPPYTGGSVTSRPASGAGSHAQYNNYYQRMSRHPAGDSYDMQVQSARDPVPRINGSGMQRKHNTAPSAPPVFRAGRVGAPWRHVRQCLGNLGNHICFVDGEVKQNDMKNYPPYGYTVPTESHTYISPRTSHAPRSSRDNQPGDNHVTTSYNARAKKGFKYWHDDNKPKQMQISPLDRMALWAGGAPKQTIQGRLMKLGVGY